MSSTPVKTHRVPQILLTILLWLLAAVLGLVAVYYIHELAYVAYAVYLNQVQGKAGVNETFTGVFFGQIAAVVGGITWLGTIIGLTEYQLKHAGEPKAWKVFGWIIGIELLFILVGLLAT